MHSGDEQQEVCGGLGLESLWSWEVSPFLPSTTLMLELVC